MLLSIVMPVLLEQGGDALHQGLSTLKPPAGPAAGDLRFGARVRIVGDERAAVQVGVEAYVFAPTAPEQSYVSDGSTRVQTNLLAGGRFGSLFWSLFAGPDVRGGGNPAAIALGAGLGCGLFDERLELRAEVYSSTLVQRGLLQISEYRLLMRAPLTTSAELLFGARLRVIDGLMVGVSTGPGLTDAGSMTPSYRFTGSIDWSPLGSADTQAERRPQADPDQDGIVGLNDACPYAWGEVSHLPKQNGCPRRDKDDDGIEDEKDVCPERAGVASDAPGKNGCPADRDGDDVRDEIDVCPELAGVPEMNGCPSDRDRDTFPDAVDACPAEQGGASDDPKLQGCPPARQAPQP